MRLKFIGKDGSLGLRYGEYYKVSLYTSNRMLVAYIRIGFLSDICCPYETLNAFAKNWSL